MTATLPPLSGVRPPLQPAPGVLSLVPDLCAHIPGSAHSCVLDLPGLRVHHLASPASLVLGCVAHIGSLWGVGALLCGRG